MAVYSLPTEPQQHVLLTGDDDFVMEFADILAAKDISFNIMPPLDELQEALLDGELDPELVAMETMKYGPYLDRVVVDPRMSETAYTMVVDLSIEPPDVRKHSLMVAGMVCTNAPMLVSTLTSTATEIGSMAETDGHVVGVGLVPSMMTSAAIVEVAAGLNTKPEYLEKAIGFLHSLGMTTELVEDRVALVQMRVLATLINEAAFAVMEGVATPADIDKAMKLGVNYPKGLLEWADEIGIPVVTYILDALYREYGQERYRPCVLLKQYLRAGWAGKSAKRGFYDYREKP